MSKTRFGKPVLTCDELSALLGVKVKSISTYPDGTVEVETASALSTARKAQLEARLGLKAEVEV